MSLILLDPDKKEKKKKESLTKVLGWKKTGMEAIRTMDYGPGPRVVGQEEKEEKDEKEEEEEEWRSGGASVSFFPSWYGMHP